MSQKKRSKAHSQHGARRRSAHLWWIPVMLVVVVGVGWFVFRGSGPSPSPSGLPGPAGGRDVAQDVNTMAGQPAPSFTLSTAEGQTHDVRLGRGRPTVLIFHMGVT